MTTIEKLAVDVYNGKRHLSEFITGGVFDGIQMKSTKTDFGYGLMLGAELLTEIEDTVLINGREFRVCSECGSIMYAGYMEEGGGSYYCSDECLHKSVSEEEYNRLYEEGAMFYTEWY